MAFTQKATVTALFLFVAAGIAQCSDENDYSPWDRRAWDSFVQNSKENVQWGYRKIRNGLAEIGSHIPNNP